MVELEGVLLECMYIDAISGLLMLFACHRQIALITTTTPNATTHQPSSLTFLAEDVVLKAVAP